MTESASPSAADRIIDLAEKLVAQISLDDNGMMIGTRYQGGNGGLISIETIKQAGALRIEISGYRFGTKPPPEVDPQTKAAAEAHAKEQGPL